MKKWLMLCMALLLSVALVACGSDNSDDDKDTKDNESTEEKSEETSDNNEDSEENAEAEEGAAADEESDTDSEESTDAEASTDSENDAAAESQDFDFDPNGENAVTLQLEQAGVIVKLTYKADGDMVYEQTANNEMPYSTLGVSTPEEAEEAMAGYAADFEGIEGVTHNFEYLDDKVVETLTVNYDEADVNEVSQLTGSEFEGDLSGGVSLQQSVQMLQAQGYEIVEE
ncbi:YehR family protein [Oceanobacillus sojae]|uniref:YehR family protein n=1 Tax=Oceanobacillus sojae TaxID=582851 RepID=UPI00158883AC|nr:YehR family protein [Oceanobacillus sojae]